MLKNPKLEMSIRQAEVMRTMLRAQAERCSRHAKFLGELIADADGLPDETTIEMVVSLIQELQLTLIGSVELMTQIHRVVRVR